MWLSDSPLHAVRRARAEHVQRLAGSPAPPRSNGVQVLLRPRRGSDGQWREPEGCPLSRHWPQCPHVGASVSASTWSDTYWGISIDASRLVARAAFPPFPEGRPARLEVACKCFPRAQRASSSNPRAYQPYCEVPTPPPRRASSGPAPWTWMCQPPGRFEPRKRDGSPPWDSRRFVGRRRVPRE